VRSTVAPLPMATPSPFTRARLGLELPAGGEPLDEVEAVYDYRDGDGRLLFEVLRKRGKQFPCRWRTVSN